jgi:hypothetical protein
MDMFVLLKSSLSFPTGQTLMQIPHGDRYYNTPYVVLLDHDDILCAGYFKAMSSWLEENQLRCAAATLRYIGESSRRVGVIVSRHPDFFMPSGFSAEAELLAEVGYFPDSYADDLLFFRAIRQATRLTTCPDAGVLYRIHPQAESSRNAKAWWAFYQLIPYYYEGSRTLPELNAIVREFSQNATIPPGMESRLRGEESAETRFLSRSAYACWLNRDFSGVARYSFKLFRHLPGLVRLARRKWSKN